MFKRKPLCCSFCGKSEVQVAKLVAGQRVFICDECVAAARRIMDTAPHGDAQLAPTRQSSRMRQVIRRLLRPRRSSRVAVQPLTAPAIRSA